MFPRCNPYYNTMDKPFSAGHTVPNSRKLDDAFSLPTFHHVDNISFNDVLFNSQLGETDHFSAPPPLPPLSTIVPQATKDIGTPSKKVVAPGRKRALRKDRHSKIHTAKGPRNRRMRLSLEVAPEFFEIQDMLGYDKASKTLRWLITAAKPAIQELSAVSGPKSSNSDPGGSSKSIESSTSELAESVDMNSRVSGNKTKSAVSSRKRESDVTPKAKRACRRPPLRKGAFPTTIIAKESRLKARARARERTEKKTLLQSSRDHLFPFEAVNEDSSSHDLKSSLDQLVAEVEEHCSHHSPNRQQQLGSGETSNELPVTIFNYNQNAMCPNVDMVNLLIHEQWDMERILQADAQLHVWEA